jgi:hypothetical protein
MQIHEKLSREACRVAVLCAQYKTIHERGYYPSLLPNISMMDEALEFAHTAAGKGEPAMILRATVMLEDFKE